MPCDGKYLKHSEREAESGRVLEFLKEINGEPFNHESPSYYGNLDTLDADIAHLCAWCKSHMVEIPSMSLELQLWWQRHQRADKRREAREQAEAEIQRRKQVALSKLNEIDLAALGLKRK